MPFPSLTVAPPAPTRSMTNEEFIASADAFVAWMVTHRDELVEWQEYLVALAASLGVSGADAELQAVASVTSAANKLFYFSGSGVGALTDFPAIARTLLAQTTQALMRTTGLGFSSDGSDLVAAADYAAMRTLLVVYSKAEVDTAVNGALAAAAAAVVPAGTVISVAMNAAPTGYLKANGTAVSRATYAALFAAIGTTYGAGDGSTTFNLPDLRGEFVRGFDDGRGVDAARAIGSSQADELKAHTHSAASNPGSGGGTSFQSTGGSTTPITTGSTGGAETRPRNVALLFCIKT